MEFIAMSSKQEREEQSRSLDREIAEKAIEREKLKLVQAEIDKAAKEKDIDRRFKRLVLSTCYVFLAGDNASPKYKESIMEDILLLFGDMEAKGR